MTKTLHELRNWASDKENFQKIEDFSAFGEEYLLFSQDGLQARIVAQKENNYIFYQYKDDGNYNITRPFNSNLMIINEDFLDSKTKFNYALANIRDIKDDIVLRNIINKFIYTCQQTIGATLDALPSGSSNKARKINGDLFERYIRLVLKEIGFDAQDGTISIPIKNDNKTLCEMKYQHDIVIKSNNIIKAIGSVKTSSKDRIDKIFVDKFLFNKLNDTYIPHFAIFLQDVQRRGRFPNFGVSTTFLPGHFKGYTIKLNPLDGVFYCDLRPNMKNDNFLSEHIHPLDKFFVEDIWKFIS